MPRERTVVARPPRCITTECPNDAVPGQGGHCSPCGQAIRRRVKAGKVTREELIARGQWRLSSPVDRCLAKVS